MSLFSRAIGREGMRKRTRAANEKEKQRQLQPGGVLNFEGQIDKAGADATGRGGTAQGAYMDRTMNFDPTAAIQKYAGAQWDTAINDPTMGLKRQVSDLGGRSVGAGRLDTGFYDEDQGDIVTKVMKGYGNSVASTAVRGAEMEMENTQNLGGYGERQSQLGLDVAGARYGDLQERAAQKAERARSKKRGIGGMIGGAIGAAGGFLAGGPAGAQAGWGIGSRVGGGF